MMDFIRSATLTHYPDVAQSVGLDPRQMLRKVRLPLASLERPDLRIAVTSVRRLLDISAIESGVEEFGLLMAKHGDFSNLGPVALVVREQSTVGTALQMLARFIHIHNEGMRLAIEHHEDVVTLSIQFRGRPLRQATEMAVGTLHRTIGHFCGDDWRALDVHFTHGPPRSRKFHRSFFGCDVFFNSEIDAIQLPASELDRVIPTAHPLMADYLERRVEAIDNRPVRWDDKVMEVVRTLLPNGKCTIEQVAEHFSCTRRTIHRHLADCGTSFSAILDAERADLALRLVEDRSRPLAMIAGMLGFSAQSALARWFKARFGCSITEWRTDARTRALAAVGRW